MASIPRIVPWTSPQEYQNVYQWLYSDSPELRELGVKRVKAWSSRGKIPQSIVFTAAFVEASLRDEFSFGKIKVSNYELRLLYSMAFIRFVNGMIDPNQGKYAKSVASIAHKLDMPSWFVDLRHAGTHEHLPSLQVLRKGCQQALKWLEDKYWTAEKPVILAQIDEIRSLIIDYKKYSKDPDSNKKISTNNVLKKISNLITVEYIRDILVPVLLENGYLIPKGKKKRSSKSNITLSTKLIEIWFPMLQKFGYEWPTFYDELVQEMLEKMTSNDEEVYINFSDQLEIFQKSESSQPKNISSSYLFTL
ncbi:4557_t:CDS:2, partial [Diversispora eburnea]